MVLNNSLNLFLFILNLIFYYCCVCLSEEIDRLHRPWDPDVLMGRKVVIFFLSSEKKHSSCFVFFSIVFSIMFLCLLLLSENLKDSGRFSIDKFKPHY